MHPHNILTLNPIITSFPSTRFSDARFHGAYQGPSRTVRLPRATSGGGALSKSEDGTRCAVTGKECECIRALRILRVSGPTEPPTSDHRRAFGKGGHRIDASRNYWEGSGLKIDSASTDVAWGRGETPLVFNNKIMTSSRNGELIMWDLNKPSSNKCERRAKDHLRSIHKISISPVVHHYCVTGSADGCLRVWDLRDMSKSIMRITNPNSVRSVVFSPSSWQPLQAVCGLDNGSLYRWDLKMGQRGMLDRVPIAHTASIMTLEWCAPPYSSTDTATSNNMGWLATGGLDAFVKVWDLTSSSSSTSIPHKPTYTLHPSFPVRRILWRPSYACELAIVSNTEFSSGSNPDSTNTPTNALGLDFGEPDKTDAWSPGPSSASPSVASPKNHVLDIGGDPVEIWDVRRQWVAKWAVPASAAEGGAADIVFGCDEHVIWTVHSSGLFAQLDLRDSLRPLDSVPRVAVAWDPAGPLAFVADRPCEWEVPYDDMYPLSQPQPSPGQTTHKALGDPKFLPRSQDVGTFTGEDESNHLETFAKLAREYVFEGDEKAIICAHNANAAYEAGEPETAQMWMLLGALLLNTTSCSMPVQLQSKEPSPLSPLQHRTQSTPTSLSSYIFPSQSNNEAGKSRSSQSPQGSSRVASRRSPSAIASRRMVPESPSTPTSAHLTPTPRQPGFRRRSADSGSASGRPLMLRGTSETTGSPGERQYSSSNSRTVGEGALDDSDSSSGSAHDQYMASEDEDDAVAARSGRSLTVSVVRSGVPAHPSPLSRPWEEEEVSNGVDEELSASPVSSESDSEEFSSLERHRQNQRTRQASKSMSVTRTSRGSSRKEHARSRSSTAMAAVAAAGGGLPFSTTTQLARKMSHSSVRTVTVSHMQGTEGPYMDSKDAIAAVHSRQKSENISEHVPGRSPPPETPEKVGQQPSDEIDVTEKSYDFVYEDEKRLRALGWTAFREAFESLADQGNIQLCAMLSLVAGKDMHLNFKRTERFVEAYLEILARLQLYTVAAYLRKYCEAHDVRKETLENTTIHVCCGKCRKPFPLPSGVPPTNAPAFCPSCQTFVRCIVCHLPVCALLVQCSVCNHGGHQACYRQYYMNRPMDPIPDGLSTSLELRGRAPLSRHSSIMTDQASTVSSLGLGILGLDASSLSSSDLMSTTATDESDSVASGRRSTSMRRAASRQRVMATSDAATSISNKPTLLGHMCPVCMLFLLLCFLSYFSFVRRRVGIIVGQ
ncbi:hypothetical protein FISHEDRAFT_52780 [Fistulina hepatica ATCC 64428]|nr:hypothetical protein FISHEDRAFT_52780 [Fistulina hepatica ATCC 64428]